MKRARKSWVSCQVVLISNSGTETFLEFKDCKPRIQFLLAKRCLATQSVLQCPLMSTNVHVGGKSSDQEHVHVIEQIAEVFPWPTLSSRRNLAASLIFRAPPRLAFGLMDMCCQFVIFFMKPCETSYST